MEEKRYLKVFNSQEEYEAQKDDVMEMPHVIFFEDTKSMMYVKETQEEDYSKEYFTIEALEDGLTIQLSTNTSQYRIDDSEWVSLNANTITPSINNGQKVSFKITNPILSRRESIGRFTINKKCNISGNIMSLLYGDDFEGQIDLSGKDYAFSHLFGNCTTLQNVKNLILPATTLAYACYEGMFYDCTSLTTAPSELPATALATECYFYMFHGCTSLTTTPKLSATTLARRCYDNMFDGCTSLTTGPALPATTLADSCYTYMFYGCTSLETAPELPATTLADSCYSNMFEGCTSLTTTPKLSATTLAFACYRKMFHGCTSLTTAQEILATTFADNCYSNMFEGCSKLNYIKMLATDISAYNCLYNWVSGVASSGTFVKNAAMTSLPSGVNGIPNGWTVENA